MAGLVIYYVNRVKAGAGGANRVAAAAGDALVVKLFPVIHSAYRTELFGRDVGKCNAAFVFAHELRNEICGNFVGEIGEKLLVAELHNCADIGNAHCGGIVISLVCTHTGAEAVVKTVFALEHYEF